MRDIGGLIWIVIVVIGVISSISKNVKKAAAHREPARPRMAQQQQQPVPARQIPARSASAAQLLVRQMLPPAPQAVVPVAPAAAPAMPAPVRRAKPPVPEAPQRAASPIRGMFGAGTSLVRAIIAAEVLGPPKSLQEQSIWSPRHSEPSI